MSLWTATPVEASRELSVYHDISHVREALAARQLLRWSGGLMFAIVGGQLPGEFVADMVRDLVPRCYGTESERGALACVTAYTLATSNAYPFHRMESCGRRRDTAEWRGVMGGSVGNRSMARARRVVHGSHQCSSIPVTRAAPEAH